jgi:glutamyl-tRNA synthetase
MHTTHVIRGEEWLPSLPIHLELFSSLGFEAPKYAHVPVIMKVDNGNRRKLSKRKDDEAAVSFFLERGYPTEGFLEYLLTIANSNFEEWRLANKDASMYDFTLTFNKMSLDGILFDLAKVQNICKEFLSRLTAKEISERAIAWAKQYDEQLYTLATSDVEFFEKIMNIERGGEKPRKDYEKYSDILPLVGFFYNGIYEEIVKNEEQGE